MLRYTKLLLVLKCFIVCALWTSPLLAQSYSLQDTVVRKSLAFDKFGKLWAVNGFLNLTGRPLSGVSVYDGIGWKSFYMSDGLFGDTATCLISDNDGNIWVGGKGGIARFDESSSRWTSYYVTDSLESSRTYTALVSDSLGRIWASSYSLKPGPNSAYHAFAEIHRFDGSEWLTYDITNRRTFAFNHATHLTIGKAGVWAAGWMTNDSATNLLEGGLYYFPFDGSSFERFTLGGTSLPHSYFRQVTSLFADSTGLHVLYTLPDESGVAGQYFDGQSWTPDSTVPVAIANCAAVDPEGKVWVGSQGVKIFRAGKLLQHYTNANSSLLDHAINSIAFDLNGNAWVSSGTGITVFKRSIQSSPQSKDVDWVRLTSFTSDNAHFEFDVRGELSAECYDFSGKRLSSYLTSVTKQQQIIPLPSTGSGILLRIRLTTSINMIERVFKIRSK